MRASFICLIVLMAVACKEAEKKQNGNAGDPFNKIENITGSDNWQLVDGNDTSYVYFSRIGNKVNVYRYEMSKGDSVNTRMNNIVLQNDSVVWNWNKEKLLLTGIDSVAINWEALNAGKEAYKLVKTDSSHLSFILPNGHTAVMKKMLPLSVFLVRQKYDYTHGTAYSDSAVNLTPNPKKK